MKPSEERLKWLIEEFLEKYEPEDFGALLQPARLKDWEVLKIADEVKQFIAAPDVKCFVRTDGQKAPFRLDEMTIDTGQVAQLRRVLGRGLGQFTAKGPAVKVLIPKKGTNVISAASPHRTKYPYSPTHR